MYRRILLASDGSRESLIALREGALLARAHRAQVFLLIVEVETASIRVADAIYTSASMDESTRLLQLGLSRLKRLEVRASGDVVRGEPTPVIGRCARRFAADLIVVGHRRQSLLERWWSGASGAYLVDHVNCSVLVARQIVSDEEFDRRLGDDTDHAVS